MLFRAIEGLLSAVSERGPVLLVLEDLHWADVPTLKLLRRLLTSPRSWALMLVCTCRVEGLGKDHPLRELLADLHREPHVLRAGSDRARERRRGGDCCEGSGIRAPGPPMASLARTLEVSTNGNPFFITELVRSLTETGASSPKTAVCA